QVRPVEVDSEWAAIECGTNNGSSIHCRERVWRCAGCGKAICDSCCWQGRGATNIACTDCGLTHFAEMDRGKGFDGEPGSYPRADECEAAYQEQRAYIRREGEKLKDEQATAEVQNVRENADTIVAALAGKTDRQCIVQAIETITDQLIRANARYALQAIKD